MAYPLDSDAQANALDALLGDDRGAKMPASFEVALFNAHPDFGGTELSATGGYARVTVANDSTTFPDASPDKTSAPIPFAAATGAWSDTATHFLLLDAADSTTRYFAGLLDDEVDVLVAGTVVTPSLRFYWDQES